MAAEQSAVSQVAGFVLAGGRSSRMGTDKALVLFHGQPLILNALAILRGAGLPASISGSRPDLSAYAPQIPDTFAASGPLGGIHAALSSKAAAEWNVFLPVDMPLMPASLIAELVSQAVTAKNPIAACTLNGYFQPFPVVLNYAVLPEIERQLLSGQRACFRAWQQIPQRLGANLTAIPVETLVQAWVQPRQSAQPSDIDPVHWFESANTPDDLARLNRHAGKNADGRRDSQVI